MHGPDGHPLTNRMGRQLYQLDYPFVYESDLAGLIAVPPDFVTDLASIPRIPILYELLNGIADEPGVIHDYLYSTAKVPRLLADQVLKEACLVSGVSGLDAEEIYWGVREFGESHYKPT